MLVKYIKTPRGTWDEVTEFRNNIKDHHLQTCKVILDFKNKQCVVNSLNREASFYDMLEMYKRLLGDKIIPHLPQD